MSYTLYTTIQPRSNTNAEFQAWGSKISDAIANCGIIKESDANVGTQINWATVANPNTDNQSRGYEIYRFDDAMQATTPVYFKIEYGSATSYTIPALWLTVGSGANASGNVTGNTTTRQQIHSQAGATARGSWFSGANNRFCMTFCQGGVVQEQMTIGLERTLDANGAVTSDGLAILMIYFVNKFVMLWTQATGNVAAIETTLPAITPGTSYPWGSVNGMGGNQLATYPLLYNKGATTFPPQTFFQVYFHTDYAVTSWVDIPMYGTTIKYVPMGNTCFYSAARGGTRTCLMMRYD